MKANLFLLACFLAAGCTSGAVQAPGPARLPMADASPQERLADALAAADLAARTGDRAGLASALADLEALRARPLEPAGEAQLAAWRRASGFEPIPMRGRTLGRGYRSGTINAGSDVVIEQTFLSGQRASIALSSADDGELALNVLDGREQSVCREQARRSTCSWVPLFTQRHTIRLTNRGREDVRYYLVVD